VEIKYPEIGVCGLSCRLCPRYYTEGESRCGGCKTPSRMGAGCPFITCAVKRKEVEFCWQCDEHTTCKKWRQKRECGRKHDSFVCYQRLDENIAFIMRDGVRAFEREQKIREGLLRAMLREFNEGRSRTLYSIAATVMEIRELKGAIAQARRKSQGMDLKAKAEVLRSILESVARENRYHLKLRRGL